MPTVAGQHTICIVLISSTNRFCAVSPACKVVYLTICYEWNIPFQGLLPIECGQYTPKYTYIVPKNAVMNGCDAAAPTWCNNYIS